MTERRLKFESPVAVQGLLLLAVVYTLYFAADFLVPVFAAIVLQLLLTPVVRWFTRHHIPEPISAAVIVIGLVGVLSLGFISLSEPVAAWAARIPEITEELKYKLRELREPVETVQEVSKQVEEATTVDTSGSTTPTVQIESPGLLDRLFSSMQTIGMQLTAMMILLYFMLAVGDLFIEKLVKAMPRLSDKKRALTIARQVENDVSNYLATTTLINIGFGAAVGLGLWLIGMPNPLLWAIFGAVLNFIPYFGGIVGIGILFVVSLLNFPTLGQALIAPGIYLGVNIVESQFITPVVLSRRLTLNPVVLFLAVAFWGYVWGVPGALMAVPLLVALKALCDHVDRWSAVGDFLGGRTQNGDETRKSRPSPSP